MVTPEQLAEARRALGRQLADQREYAGLTQLQLARLTGYTRSAIANVETGRSTQPRNSWRRYDELLHAEGALLAASDQYTALAGRYRQQAAAERERQRAAKIDQWRATHVAPPALDLDGTLLGLQPGTEHNIGDGADLAPVAGSDARRPEPGKPGPAVISAGTGMDLDALRRALDAYDMPPDGPVRPLDELQAYAAHVVRLRLESRYHQLGLILPQMLPELGRALEQHAGQHRTVVAGLLMQAYRAADAIADSSACSTSPRASSG